MSALSNKLQEFTIFEGIECHPAWHGLLTGISTEKMLRKIQVPFTYILRKGEHTNIENEEHYYVSFVLPDLTVKHQALIVTTSPEGWCYENGKPGGPFQNISLEPVLHLIMHCEEGQCTPLIKR
jgi:hypothetical protein